MSIDGGAALEGDLEGRHVSGPGIRGGLSRHSRDELQVRLKATSDDTYVIPWRTS